MAKKTHTGRCHCGRVSYEGKFDIATGSGKCHGSVCRKARLWGVRVSPQDFRLLSGEPELTDCQFDAGSCRQLFCKHCGAREQAANTTA